MDKRLSFRSLILFIVAVFSVVSLSVGCGIFGGKGEEEAPAEKPAAPAVSQAPQAAEPLPAAETSDESKFQSDKLDYEVKTVNGVLNWSKGFIKAKGFGIPPENAVSDTQAKLMAFRAAYADALANLLEITTGVHVTATTTVKDYMVKDHTIELKVEGVIKGSKEVKRVFDEEKNVAIVEVGIAMEDVAMSIPKQEVSFDESASFDIWETKEDATLRAIAGDNEELLSYIKTSRSLDEIEKKLEDMAEKNKNLADRNEQLLASIAALTQEIEKLKSLDRQPIRYTGVVINAAGSGIKPCMAPNIYYWDGSTYRLLYGLNDGRPRDANMHALVVWERTLTGASNNSRVTTTPLFVNATHLAKEQSALAVSAEDARTIEKIDEEKGLLKEGRVVIVR